MGFRILAVAVCAALLGPAPRVAWADPPFRYPEGQCGPARLRYVNGVPVLAVEGTPEEIGRAIGRLALGPGRRIAAYPDDLLSEYGLSWLRRPLLLAGEPMLRRCPQDYRAELEATYAAADLDHELAVLNNTFFDLKKTVLCSGLLVTGERSTTGGPLLGRNLDYPPLGYAHDYSLVTVYRPRDARHAFALVGFPGTVGCLSGMNDAGLAVAVMEVYQARVGERLFDLRGTPFAMCFRRLLEECGSIEEARSQLAVMNRTGLNNLTVADRDGVAVFEITPDRVVVRRPRRGALVCTNHFCTEALRPAPTVNLFETLDHYAALRRAKRQRDRLGPEDLQAALHAVCDPKMTLQTMVFEPRTLRLRLAVGTVPASGGEMKVVDLGPLLRAP
ncbi:MAG TPA: C45 family peptidase [Gemmataceae bacterium]|nr:C45 family peptidase [Gemmataceae bacterium]